MNTPPDRDEEFEAALRARRRLLPRFDDADDAEPPAELDRIVLARARDAARAAPTRPGAPERHYRGPRWAVPLALVATVLLSFTLVMQLDPARNDTVLAPRDTLPAAATTEAANDAYAGDGAAAGAGVAADAGADADTDADAGTAARAGAAAASVAAQRVPTPVASAPAASPPAAPRSSSLDSPSLARTVPAAPPAPAGSPATALAEVSDRPVPPVAEAQAAPTAARRDALPRERAPAPLAKAAPAAPMAEASSAAGLHAAAEANAPTSMADARSERADAAVVGDGDAAAWLERIERLRLDGELEAARAELAAFTRRFPDHPLPAALEALRRDAMR